MTDTPSPPSAADIALIADVRPRRQDQDPEAFTIYQVLRDQRAAQQIELRTSQEQGTMMWAGLSKPPLRGIYVDMSDDDLWAEAVTTKVRRAEHLKSPEGRAGRNLNVAIQRANDILQKAIRMQAAQGRSFRDEAGLIRQVLEEAKEDFFHLGKALGEIDGALEQITEGQTA